MFHCDCRHLVFVLFVSSVVPHSALADDKKPATDREKLVGTWTVQEFHDDGQEKMPRLTGRALTAKHGPERYPRLVFTADECYLLRPGKEGGVRERVAGLTNVNFKTVMLDEKAKTLDITPYKQDDAAKDTTLPGIYELKGDTLRICCNETPGQSKNARPTAFKSDGNMNLLVCVRQSDTPEKPAAEQELPVKKEKP